MNEIEIIPAVMPRSFTDIEEKVFLVKGLVPFVQIDIMDGKFTTHSTWPYKIPDDEMFKALKREEQGLPYWEDIDYEFDLMVENPEEKVGDFLSAGASRIIVHLETITNWQEITDLLRGRAEIGVAINITTPVDLLETVIAEVDFIQCMGIRRIGYQGEPFDEAVLGKIQDIKQRWPEKMVSVDGGVNADSAPALADAGARRLVAGSAIFGSGDVHDAIQKLMV